MKDGDGVSDGDHDGEVASGDHVHGDGKIIVRMKNINVVTKDLKSENIVWQNFFFQFLRQL